MIGSSEEVVGPLVSIVIPCYNVENILELTLSLIRSQDYSNYEVIMVDDGSTDRSLEIMRKYQALYSKFSLIRQDHKGVSAARNLGASEARSEYIAFLDADDKLYKHSISKRIHILVEHDNRDLLGVFCPAELVFEDGKSMGFPPLFEYFNLPNDRLYFPMTSESVFNPSCVILKKSKFVAAGGFDEKKSYGEDYLLWHEMMRSGGYFMITRSCKIGYTQHQASAVNSNLLNHYLQCKQTTEKIFSEDISSVSEYRGGFGNVAYYQSTTNRAFETAIKAIATKRFDIAKEVSLDINRQIIEATHPIALESRVKSASLRALCLHSEEWPRVAWPQIQHDVLNFLGELNQNFGGDCLTLLELIGRLNKDSQSRSISIDTFTPSRMFRKMKSFFAHIRFLRDWLRHNPKSMYALIIILIIYSILVMVLTETMKQLIRG